MAVLSRELEYTLRSVADRVKVPRLKRGTEDAVDHFERSLL